MTERVQVWVDANSVTIYWRQYQVARFGVANGHLHAKTSDPVDVIEWVRGLPLAVEDIEVELHYMVYPNPDTEGDMALPKRKRVALPTRTKAKAARASVSANVDRIDDGDVMKVRAALLDAMLDNPHATKAEQAAVSRQIAKRHKGLNVYQVAGVRAAMTRGVYGDIDALLRARRRLRHRSNSA